MTAAKWIFFRFHNYHLNLKVHTTHEKPRFPSPSRESAGSVEETEKEIVVKFHVLTFKRGAFCFYENVTLLKTD